MDAFSGLILLYDWRRAAAKPNRRQPQEETAITAAGRTIASKQANNPPKSAPASCLYVYSYLLHPVRYSCMPGLPLVY